MPERADAHIHLFEGGFQSGFTKQPGVRIDEPACYGSLAADHGVSAALVVGFCGNEAYADNNEFLARMAAEHAWVRPVAYFDAQTPPPLEQLDARRKQGFVGVSIYVFSQESVDALQQIPDEFWSWLVDHDSLVSVNSRGEFWTAWLPILQRHGDLHVVLSHCGLPPGNAIPPAPDVARENLATVLELAAFPGPCVKLSGFYALSDPPSDYPHESAWPYVEVLLKNFGPRRLLWGSDFVPYLEHLSFPQTFGHFAKMPFLDEAQRQRIEGGNLLELLEKARA